MEQRETTIEEEARSAEMGRGGREQGCGDVATGFQCWGAKFGLCTSMSPVGARPGHS